MDKAQFEQIGRESFNKACGDVRFDRLDWLNVSWSTLNSSQTLGFYLTVGPVGGQFRTVGSGNRAPVDGHRTASVQRVVSSLTLSTLVSPEDTVKSLFDTMVREIRPLVYELDPRIGTLWETTDHCPLAPCPLFDPPRFVFPALRGMTEVPGVPTYPCPFCHGEFTRDEPPMWGGGDLRWAHASCWGHDL